MGDEGVENDAGVYAVVPVVSGGGTLDADPNEEVAGVDEEEKETLGEVRIIERRNGLRPPPEMRAGFSSGESNCKSLNWDSCILSPEGDLIPAKAGGRARTVPGV